MPRELAYIQRLSDALDQETDAKRERQDAFDCGTSDDYTEARITHNQRESYVLGMREATRIIWGEEKEAELYRRATSPDDSTM